MNRPARVPASTAVRMNRASNRMAKWYQNAIIALPPIADEKICAMPTASVGAGPVAKFFRLLGEPQVSAAEHNFWLQGRVLRRSTPYLWLRRNKGRESAISSQTVCRKLCDRPLLLGLAPLSGLNPRVRAKARWYQQPEALHRT